MGGGLRLKGLLHDGDVRVVFSFVLLVMSFSAFRLAALASSAATTERTDHKLRPRPAVFGRGEGVCA
jgi:hypothetical protein